MGHEVDRRVDRRQFAGEPSRVGLPFAPDAMMISSHIMASDGLAAKCGSSTAQPTATINRGRSSHLIHGAVERTVSEPNHLIIVVEADRE